MPNAVDLTTILGSGGSIAAATVAVITVRRQAHRERREDEQDRDATDVASWTALNNALGVEVHRLNDEVARMRADYERQLREQEARHERERAADRKRIEDLERDVESLRRLLRGGGSSPP